MTTRSTIGSEERTKKDELNNGYMKKILIISSLIFLVILVIHYATGGGIVPKQNCRDVQEPYTEWVEYQEQECQQVPYTDTICETKELTYKSTLDKMTQTETCTKSHKECIKTKKDFWGNINCVQWQTVCDEFHKINTFDLTNLDSETGTWCYTWYRICYSNQPVCTYENAKKIYSGCKVIESTETQTIRSDLVYLNNAKEYAYVTWDAISTKQVCRDVIKIREDCHTVTKQRKETRYRTVRECD